MLPRFFRHPCASLGLYTGPGNAVLVYWSIQTTMGMEIRAVGANPDGARYAGMNIVP